MNTEQNIWWYIEGGNQIGPVTWSLLCTRANKGLISNSDYIWKVGWESWVSAHKIEGLLPNQRLTRNVPSKVPESHQASSQDGTSNATPPLKHTDNEGSGTTNSRHGCLAAWLLFMVIGNALAAIMYMSYSAQDQSMPLDISDTESSLLALLTMSNIVCAVALHRWRKWGYHLFIINSMVIFIINISAGVGAGTSISGLIGILFLYGVLKIGGSKSGWDQLQ
jgi:hypothetical protein